MKKIFSNGHIYTMNARNPRAEAILVENDKIKLMGDNEAVLAQQDEKTKIIDLKGKFVLPGFNDSHMHLLAYGKSLNEVNLMGAKSIEEVLERAKEFLVKNPDTKCLVGAGWNHELFVEKRMLNKHDLDKISQTIPIAFSRACHHITACNSKALELAGIHKDLKAAGGEIEIVDGEPSGILKENACRLLRDMTANMSKEEKRACILKAMDKLVSFGVTTVQSDDIKDNDFQETMTIYKELEKEGKMKVRVYQQCRLDDPLELREALDKANAIGSGIDYKMGPLKLLIDGSLGGGTAYMNAPYEDDETTCGILNYPEEFIEELVYNAHVNNIAVAIHAIGDRAIDIVINSIEKAQKKKPQEDLRHAIIHCQITSREALDRIVENNIVANVQPIFLNNDIAIVEKRVGPERAKHSYNWKSLLDRGVLVCFGTDCPIESPNPLKNIFCAVNRCSLEGEPQGGWLPEEKFTLTEALQAYTLNSAKGVYGEKELGSLEAGKYADFVVLSENLYEINPLTIKDTECLMTVKGGEIVYTAN